MVMPIEHGLSCLVTSTGSIALAGTRGYLAPEFVAGKVGPKVDVYSYGIVSFLLHFVSLHVQYEVYSYRCVWRPLQG